MKSKKLDGYIKQAMSSVERNVWKLCSKHSNCSKCKSCIDSWKKKANKHAYNAIALKFVIQSMMNDNTDFHPIDAVTNNLPKINVTELRSTQEKSKCGICEEFYTYGGEHNHISFACGHTVCLKCYNNELFRERKKCPYCRNDIKKAVKLWLEEEGSKD